MLGPSCAMRALICGMWDLVPPPGIKPGPSALGGWSLSHWANRKSLKIFLMWTIFFFLSLYRICCNVASALFYFWPRGIWDLSSLDQGSNPHPWVGRQSLNGRTTREVPRWTWDGPRNLSSEAVRKEEGMCGAVGWGESWMRRSSMG